MPNHTQTYLGLTLLPLVVPGQMAIIKIAQKEKFINFKGKRSVFILNYQVNFQFEAELQFCPVRLQDYLTINIS